MALFILGTADQFSVFCWLFYWVEWQQLRYSWPPSALSVGLCFGMSSTSGNVALPGTAPDGAGHGKHNTPSPPLSLSYSHFMFYLIFIFTYVCLLLHFFMLTVADLFRFSYLVCVVVTFSTEVVKCCSKRRQPLALMIAVGHKQRRCGQFLIANSQPIGKKGLLATGCIHANNKWHHLKTHFACSSSCWQSAYSCQV